MLPVICVADLEAALTDCARFMLYAFRDALIQRRVSENGTVGSNLARYRGVVSR
jgi:hypothetical protein